LNFTNHGRLQLDRDIVASLGVISGLIMMSQDDLFRVGSVICVTVAKGGIPIRTPRIQFKPTRRVTLAWHCVLDCGVIEVKGPIPLEVL
jgi:hypothetical protein